MRVLIKSKYIHYGRQVFEKEIEISTDEQKMLDSLGVKYVVKNEIKVKKNESI